MVDEALTNTATSNHRRTLSRDKPDVKGNPEGPYFTGASLLQVAPKAAVQRGVDLQTSWLQSPTDSRPSLDSLSGSGTKISPFTDKFAIEG